MKIILFCFTVLALTSCKVQYYEYHESKLKIFQDLNKIKDPRKVQALDLSHQKLKSYDFLFEYENLVFLNIDNSGIDEFPDQICKLHELKVLSIGQNPIKFLPDCLFTTSIENLSLRMCRLDYIPLELGRMNLTTLVIMGNEVQKATLDSLKYLLPNCNIKSHFN